MPCARSFKGTAGTPGGVPSRVRHDPLRFDVGTIEHVGNRNRVPPRSIERTSGERSVPGGGAMIRHVDYVIRRLTQDR
jgi:hypothetical protein